MSMLSTEALKWLKSVNYESKTHEERMKLIEAAHIAYPNTEEDETEEMRFMRIMGLA